jgi:flavin reductase (DIM6/NTAB) family NADH-FMN oxidoreductase RutF
MFYAADSNDHGLKQDPFKAIVAPRPIGWVGTRGRDGSRNLSPYSFFNAVSERPKLVMFASAGRKDSARNCEETGVFTTSLVSRPLAARMNASSATVPYGVDEFALSGLTPAPGRLVEAPFVAEAHAALECRVTEILRPRTLSGGAAESWVVIGQVVGIHLSEEIVREGRVDMGLARPVGRMGYLDYCEASEVFELLRPAAK